MQLWNHLSLTRRFAVLVILVLACNAAVLTVTWSNDTLRRNMVASSARSASTFLQAALEPLVQDLAGRSDLSPEAVKRLEALFSVSPFADARYSLRLWRPGGSLLYASGSNERGSGQPAPALLEVAQTGKAHIEIATGEETADHDGTHFEVLTPLKRSGTTEVLAIAEFHEISPPAATVGGGVLSWPQLGAFAAILAAALLGIVWSAKRELDRHELVNQRAAASARLAEQNRQLRKQVWISQRRNLDLNERLLRRIGSDLHDGPAQNLGLILLKLDELAPQGPGSAKKAAAANTLELIRRATSEALHEIRNISAGLSLPELRKVTPVEALQIAIRAHERTTGTKVDVRLGCLPQHLPMPMTICLYRFVQEALNNAFRHAGGAGQRVVSACDGQSITLEVSDNGPGFTVDKLAKANDRLGLAGLRHRIEGIGGTFKIHAVVGEGTRLSVTLRNPYAVATVKEPGMCAANA